MMAAVALANLSLMVLHPIPFTTLENNVKSHKICPALQTTSYACIKQDPMLPSQYIGQTCRTLRERFGEHRRAIQNNTDESVPIHFNQPNHTLNDVQLIPILHINNNRDSIRLSMEQHLIENTGTLQNDLNRISCSIGSCFVIRILIGSFCK